MTHQMRTRIADWNRLPIHDSTRRHAGLTKVLRAEETGTRGSQSQPINHHVFQVASPDNNSSSPN